MDDCHLPLDGPLKGSNRVSSRNEVDVWQGQDSLDDLAPAENKGGTKRDHFGQQRHYHIH